jgi:hypothetical protein
MKRFFASLAMGLLIPALVVVLILTLKVLYPGTTSGMFMLWFFVWPMPLLFRLFPDLGTETTALIAFAVGTVVDIAIFSLLSYLSFRAIQRSKSPTF